jgi:hypothetical protein
LTVCAYGRDLQATHVQVTEVGEALDWAVVRWRGQYDGERVPGAVHDLADLTGRWQYPRSDSYVP